MPTAWRSFPTRYPVNYDWAAARCLACERRWTWHRRAGDWHHPAPKIPLYRMLCPACLGPLSRVRVKAGLEFRWIPHGLVRCYMKGWPGERP